MNLIEFLFYIINIPFCGFAPIDVEFDEEMRLIQHTIIS